jgi:hypothetical protein
MLHWDRVLIANWLKYLCCMNYFLYKICNNYAPSLIIHSFEFSIARFPFIIVFASYCILFRCVNWIQLFWHRDQCRFEKHYIFSFCLKHEISSNSWVAISFQERINTIELSCFLCTKCTKRKQKGLAMFARPSARFNLRTDGGILIKFVIDVMSLEATLKPCF